MGGPKKGKGEKTQVADLTRVDDDPSKAAPTLDNALKDYTRGGYQDSYQKLLQIEKTDPKTAEDPKFKKLKKHVEIELNIG